MTDDLRARIAAVLEECRILVPEAQADAVMAVVQDEIEQVRYRAQHFVRGPEEAWPRRSPNILFAVRHADGGVTRHIMNRAAFVAESAPLAAAQDQDLYCDRCPTAYRHEPLGAVDRPARADASPAIDDDRDEQDP